MEVVKVLIASGGSVNKANNNGFTPLHIASQNGHLDVVNFLISSRGSINQADNRGWTPLHLASQNGHLAIAKVLIVHGANYDHKNKYGRTPVDVANNNETKSFILKEIRWSRRRSLILTRPYDDFDTHEEHQLTPLGNIITAIKSNDDPSSQDSVLYQLKMKIPSFL